MGYRIRPTKVRGEKAFEVIRGSENTGIVLISSSSREGARLMEFEAVIRVRYKVNEEEAPGSYGTSDPKKMAEIDQEGFKDHPESLLALVGPEGFTVEVRPVK